jgi:hypothetical protein
VTVSAATATRITIQPPSGDLIQFGAHDLYVTNGAFQSPSVRVLVGRSLSTGFSAYDPALKRLYALSPFIFNGPASDLNIIDGAGTLLATVPGIASNIRAMALTADGHYLFIAATPPNSAATIIRYDTIASAVDLKWSIAPLAGQTTSDVYSILTPTDSPQGLIVSTTDGRVVIFDRDGPRPYDSVDAGLPLTGYPAFFASAGRIYVGTGGPASNNCWRWLDYDAFGISGAQIACTTEPPETQHDHGVAYLSDGIRAFGISIPAAPLSTSSTAAGLAVDLSQRHVWQFAVSFNVIQLFDYPLDTQQLALKAQIAPISSSGPVALYAAGGGPVLVVTGGYVLLAP